MSFLVLQVDSTDTLEYKKQLKSIWSTLYVSSFSFQKCQNFFDLSDLFFSFSLHSALLSDNTFLSPLIPSIDRCILSETNFILFSTSCLPLPWKQKMTWQLPELPIKKKSVNLYSLSKMCKDI